MQLTRLRVLLVQELRRLYDAEQAMLGVPERLVTAAGAEELKALLQDGISLASEHLHRLEAVFSGLGESPRGTRAESMRSLLREGEDQLGAGGNPRVLDAAILIAVSRACHWKLATYSLAIAYAGRLGLEPVVHVLTACNEQELAWGERLERLAASLELRAEQDT